MKIPALPCSALPRHASPRRAAPRRAAPSHAIIVLALLVLSVKAAYPAATQLPNGQQCFQTATGPVSSGSLQMFYPSTTTPKPTWIDPNQSVQNNSVIQLDGNGCAILWGVGSYRQQLWDGPVVGGAPSGNMIFDLTVQDISSQFNWFWAGTAAGTVNAIQLADAAWTPTAGQNIQFQPIGANTGPVTLSPNTGVTPIEVRKDTVTGPVGLTGGELGGTNSNPNVANVVYDSTANIFHLQNPLAPAGAAGGIPIGGEISCAGFNAPTGFLFESGQLVDRGTYGELLSQLTSTQIGTLTSGAATVTGLTSTEQLRVNMSVEGANIPGSTTIASISGPTSLTLSNNATGSSSSPVIFYAYGNGDGSSTFQLPDRRGRVLYGRDNMGGSIAQNLTPEFYGSPSSPRNPDSLGAVSNPLNTGGAANGGGVLILRTNLPNIGFAVNIPYAKWQHHHAYEAITPGGTPVAGSGTFAADKTVNTNDQPSAPINCANTEGCVSSGGSGTAISTVNPGVTTNWCIRVQ